jgi:GNAT superfamily N-acetyltransferase
VKYTIERNPAFSDADIAQLNNLYKVLDQGKPVASSTNHALVASAYAAGTTVLIARHETGRIISMATLVLEATMTGWSGVIEHVTTLPSYMGNHIGSDLVSALVEEARRREARYVDLTSHPRRNTHRFYTRLGFEGRETNNYRYKLGRD